MHRQPERERRKTREELPQDRGGACASGLDHDVFMTEGTGHAIEIASGLRDSDYDLIVAIGGDGTVHEVAMASEAHQRGSG
ncbi:MAG: hypothetical protein Ct9H90mP1_1840 [Methanobacteriota archaeon]|nr:MAG: hypothetical protein Ct9H90mP1_1840 [Euryarchaeota archaeon]